MLSLSAFDFASSGLASHRPSISTKPTRRAASTWAGPINPVPMMPALIVRMMRGRPFNQLVGCCCKSQCSVRNSKSENRNSKQIRMAKWPHGCRLEITSWEDTNFTNWHQFGTIANLRFHLIEATLVQPLFFFEATTDSRTATHLAPSTKSA